MQPMRILLVMTYAVETWRLTKTHEKELWSAQKTHVKKNVRSGAQGKGKQRLGLTWSKVGWETSQLE